MQLDTAKTNYVHDPRKDTGWKTWFVCREGGKKLSGTLRGE